MEELYKVVNTNGVYSCGSIGITVEEWFAMLQDKKAEPYIETLLYFLREPEHKAACSQLAAKYGKDAQHYNAKNTRFAQWVQKKLGRFTILGTDGVESYWCVTMEKGYDTKKGFQWQLREELVEALRKLLMNRLIEEMRSQVAFNGYDEEYKWEIINNAAGKDELGIVKGLFKQNIVDSFAFNDIFKTLCKQTPKELAECIRNLFDESRDLDDRIQTFKDSIQSLYTGDKKRLANDERTAAALLTCKYPQKYTIYQDTLYRLICQYLGYGIQKPGAKYSHFTSIINSLASEYGEEIQQLFIKQIENYECKPLNLAVQTLFWCLQDKMKKDMDMEFDSKEKAETHTHYDNQVAVWKHRKNIVLYGAPGSGKTHDVPELVVRLCDPNFDADNEGREELMNRYNLLKQEKRVMFTTFHQSMDYEDWIEGLKPSVENGQVTYEVQAGIFKQLCEEANRPVIKSKQTGIADDAVVWKVSLCGTGDNPVRKECMENSHIRIGWDGYGSDISDETDWSVHNGEGKQILDAFINKMKEGDIVMSCYSSKTIDAIGVVVGDYEYNESYQSYRRLRKVKWLKKGINENIVEMNDGKTMTLSTVYRLNAITLDKVKLLLDKYKTPTAMDDNTKPYVMVIDEMNRGNVSNVFGELITLLEPDKRKGQKNAESVMLPYSKVPFCVPDNVYVIATMNTADRSLNTLDYAIRRRFAFFATKPYELDVAGFNKELFRKVSLMFVKNYDEYAESSADQTKPLVPADTLSEDFKPEEVWIGHSYFIMIDENGEDVTQERLLYEIIPLLEEYVQDGVLTAEAQKTIKELYEIATAE